MEHVQKYFSPHFNNENMEKHGKTDAKSSFGYITCWKSGCTTTMMILDFRGMWWFEVDVFFLFAFYVSASGTESLGHPLPSLSY